MKSVVIFCRTVDPQGYPFGDGYHWNAYFDLLLALKARGAEAYFAADNETYAGQGRFMRAFTAEAKVPVEKLQRISDVRAGLVLEKGGFTGTDVLVINPPFVHDITSDKAATYRHFGYMQPKTVICANQAEAEAALAQMPGELAAVKAPVSNRGREVWIDTRKKLLAKLPNAYPIIVQEFLDTAVGVPGLVAGIHDVRVKIAGGKVLGGMVRTPAPGDYRANLDQGGSGRHLLPSEIPKPVLDMARQIDRLFERYPRYYAIDVVHTAEGWKLIELNSKPGLSPVSAGGAAAQVTEQLAEYLISICPET